MRTRCLLSLLVCWWLSVAGTGCNRRSSDFVLSLEQVGQLSRTNTTKLSFEEKDGFILVSVTDRHGRIHHHELNYDTSITEEQALGVLKHKQSELEGQR
jgi:hypothetical protein